MLCFVLVVLCFFVIVEKWVNILVCLFILENILVFVYFVIFLVIVNVLNVLEFLVCI